VRPVSPARAFAFWGKDVYWSIMPIPFMQYTTLQFSSIEALLEFRNLTELRNYHIDEEACTLKAQLSEKQMELALILKATLNIHKKQ
jgi:hypothetical protein